MKFKLLIMRKLVLSFAIILSAITSFAQDDFIFSADRPGATTGTDIMERHKVQWETGMNFENVTALGASVRTWNINNSLIRFGFSDYAEFRASASVDRVSFDGGSICNLSDLRVGTKVKIFDGYKAAPAISLLAEIIVPGGKDADFMPERVGGNIHLLFNNYVCSWFSLGYDVGVTWTGDVGAREQVFAGICFGFQPVDRLSLFLEEYNTFAEETSVMTEFGAAFMLTKRLQIDAYADLNLKDFRNYYNVGFGVAWKIN